MERALGVRARAREGKGRKVIVEKSMGEDYVSTVMTKTNAEQEIKEAIKIFTEIDPFSEPHICKILGRCSTR